MFQRVTSSKVLQAVKWLRDQDVAVVVDVDDDLSAIHPSNPAWTYYDPNRAKHEVQAALRTGKLKPQYATFVQDKLEKEYVNSWNNLLKACRYASLVTVSTPGLLKRYAPHGRGVVLPNYLPEHYYQTEHVDSELVGWPAAMYYSIPTTQQYAETASPGPSGKQGRSSGRSATKEFTRAAQPMR